MDPNFPLFNFVAWMKSPSNATSTGAAARLSTSRLENFGGSFLTFFFGVGVGASSGSQDSALRLGVALGFGVEEVA